MAMDKLIFEHPFKPPQVPDQMIWTGSAVRMFRKCKRKFFWKYLMRLKPKGKSAALFIGSAFHASLAKWYGQKRAAMKPIALEQQKRLRDEITSKGELYDQEEHDALETALDTLVGMLTAYAEVYGSDKQWTVDPKNVETKFEIDLGDFIFRGMVDLCARDKEGNFIGEHKTASQIPDSYIDRLPLDTQVRGYIYGALYAKGFKASRVLYNVTKKCKLRRKGNEGLEEFNTRIQDDFLSRPNWYFFREMLIFSRSDLQAFEHELRQTDKEYHFARAQSNPKDPRSWLPNDGICNEYFKQCPYLNLCTKGLDKGTASMYVQGETMHEELDESTE